jgi:hypothetical protein
MSPDYEFELTMLKSAKELNQIDELSYKRIYEMLMESDGECLDRLETINDELAKALADHKRQKISDRLVIGAEKIEATEDPKEKARLMVHYNNLLKELTA